MIGISTRGDNDKTTKALKKLLDGDIYSDLERYGQIGVAALASATPTETGLTAHSWTYKVFRGKKPGVAWYNTNMVGGTSVAVLIQYGHGTGTGGYVAGRDFINPVIQPLFDRFADEIWKKVTKS